MNAEGACARLRSRDATFVIGNDTFVIGNDVCMAARVPKTYDYEFDRLDRTWEAERIERSNQAIGTWFARVGLSIADGNYIIRAAAIRNPHWRWGFKRDEDRWLEQARTQQVLRSEWAPSTMRTIDVPGSSSEWLKLTAVAASPAISR